MLRKSDLLCLANKTIEVIPAPQLSSMTSNDYYHVLGLPNDASESDIKGAYRKLALRWHPDKNPSQPQESDAQFKLISEAYETLRNPVSRSAYDAKLNQSLMQETPEDIMEDICNLKSMVAHLLTREIFARGYAFAYDDEDSTGDECDSPLPDHYFSSARVFDSAKDSSRLWSKSKTIRKNK